MDSHPSTLSPSTSAEDASRVQLGQSEQIRQTDVTVDLSAVVRNLARVRQQAPQATVCAMIKADAYGHGAVPVGRALAAAGVEWLGVALVEEGVALRKAGIKTPVLVLGDGRRAGFRRMLEHDLVPVVGTVAQIEAARDAAQEVAAACADKSAQKRPRPTAVHLEINTGMNRLGFDLHELEAGLSALAACSEWVTLQGVFTHLANADAPGHPLNRVQLERWDRARGMVRAAGLQPLYWHVGNSGAVVSGQAAALAWNYVRPGLMLYGCDPLETDTVGGDAGVGLEPAMQWETEVLRVREVPAGTPVSYGDRFCSKRPSRIATIGVGYGDGYRRSMSGRAQVLVRGQRVPVVGTVCMDFCMLDVTDLPEAQAGDRVTLMGRQGDNCIHPDELALWSDTIAYEVFCGVSARVPRRYIESAAPAKAADQPESGART